MGQIELARKNYPAHFVGGFGHLFLRITEARRRIFVVTFLVFGRRRVQATIDPIINNFRGHEVVFDHP